MQPPRKKQISAVAKGKQPAKSRRSKLAHDNDISAADEQRIKETWDLFHVEPPENFEEQEDEVMKTSDLRRALKAQGLAPDNAKDMRDIIGAVNIEGYVTYSRFVEICALRMNSQSDESNTEEVREAYRLFTKGSDGPINIQHLRRVAKDLKEDISDEILRNMILEANGGAGVSRGVGIDDFHAVMVRAGVFQ